MLCLALGSCSSPLPGAVVDQVGNPIAAGSPRRIVSLAPDVVELAFAVGAGGFVIAAPAAADFPAEARSLPRINPGDAESVLAFSPDLILASTAGNDPRVVDRLRQVGVATCTFDVTSFARLLDAISLVGEVTGHADRARALRDELAERTGAARRAAERLEPRRALYVVWWEPLIVAAPGTFHDDLLRTAHLINLAPASAGRYPRVDPEVLLDPRLEVIVAPDEPDVRATFATLLPRPAGARLRAGATRLIWLPADPANRPGPRLVDALEALVAARRAQP